MTSPSSTDLSRAVVLDYGDPAAEYAALRAGALLVDHADRELWTFRGAQARDTLAGLVTNDVASLAVGHGVYAAALTPKGRVVADLRILALAEHLLVDVPARANDGWTGVVRKYVNPRLARYERVTDAMRTLGLYGARARDVLADAFSLAPSALASLAPYAHATVQTARGTLVVARVPDLGVDGFCLYATADAFDDARAVVARMPGVVAGGQRAYDTARIEAGYPAWGVDIDDTTIPQEANFDELHAISYTKGCYTGQEVVARVHFRGHVNRHLRGLAHHPDDGALASGSKLFDETGRDVGDVRSAAISPRLGGVALGMVRREVALGATLVVRHDATPDVERRVTICSLPFPL